MRKIPAKYENPIDNCILDIADGLTEQLHKIPCMTPNIITTMSLLFGMLSIYCFTQKQFVLAGLFYFISYIFDCTDGHFARKYNMVTDFGDLYDHFKDISIFGVMFYLLIKEYNDINTLYAVMIPLILIPFGLCMFKHLGYQERYYNLVQNKVDSESKTLMFMDYLCDSKQYSQQDIENKMMVTKHTGCGTIVALLILFIVLLKCIHK